MNQKTRFTNFGIWNQSIIGRYIGINPKKAKSVDLYLKPIAMSSPLGAANYISPL